MAEQPLLIMRRISLGDELIFTVSFPLIKTVTRYITRHVFQPRIEEKEVVEAYDLWSENYDSQPGNLMLDLDQAMFSKLFNGIDLKNKHIADIGCGTGRHWPVILESMPQSLTGFDVSPGMLSKLKEKFPAALTYTIPDNRFAAIEDHSYDVILSTLTIAHIKNLDEALNSWCRILKDKSDIFITDFHPDALASGGKRTFMHQKSRVAVQNFIHPLNTIRDILAKNNVYAVAEYETKIDDSVKSYYLDKNALHVYEKFNGFPIIYGIHFRRIE